MDEYTFALWALVTFFLEPFKQGMTDQAYSLMVQTVASGMLLALFTGAISAVWGACGALASLRRSKRG